ncbi:MAG: hypothetical protein DRQ63_12235 [Gammaproteobacteria bacterium]|nr:MAG: hypothetical protein DRQ63_12235 [Gammaproteobacteria bacterium]
MMKIIAHRGNIYGPNKERENSPEYIEEAIVNGYDVEVDLRYIDGGFYLGHDSAKYKVDFKFLSKTELWIHCKNFGALNYLIDSDLNYFYHDGDNYTLTSHNFIWCYPRMIGASMNTVCVLPEWGVDEVDESHFAICTDFADDYYDKTNFI